MKKLKILTVAGMIAMSSLMGVFQAFAEEVSQSMTVSPPTQRIVLIPGESYSNTIKVSNANASTRALKYEVLVGSFSENGGQDGVDDYGTVDHVSRSSYNQLMDWISFDKERGTVEPNSTDFVNYTINVPENAPGGGQYATIIVRDVTGEDDNKGGNVAIQSVYQFGSIIYAEVAGETVQKGAVVNNSVPTISFSTPFVVSSMVENNGNVHTDAKYTLEIRSLFSDEEIYTNVEDPKTSLILPETKRYNTQEWADAPMLGLFKVKQTVEIYDAVSTVEKVVLICPLWLMLIVVFVIVTIVVWLVARSRARKK